MPGTAMYGLGSAEGPDALSDSAIWLPGIPPVWPPPGSLQCAASELLPQRL